MVPNQRTDVPPYQDLIFPTLKAVAALGRSAQGREITNRVLEDIGATDDQIAVTYDSRPKSVLIDRLEWARSYAKLGGMLDSPRRGLYVLSTSGRDVIAMPEAEAIEFVLNMNRQVRASRSRSRQETSVEILPVDETEIDAVPRLDEWLGSLFDPENLDLTCAQLSAAGDPDEGAASRQEAAR